MFSNCQCSFKVFLINSNRMKWLETRCNVLVYFINCQLWITSFLYLSILLLFVALAKKAKSLPVNRALSQRLMMSRRCPVNDWMSFELIFFSCVSLNVIDVNEALENENEERVSYGESKLTFIIYVRCRLSRTFSMWKSMNIDKYWKCTGTCGSPLTCAGDKEGWVYWSLMNNESY